MKKEEIMTKMNRTFNRAGLVLKKHSPEIMMTVGIVGTVASTIMACKATMKVDEILDNAKNTVDVIHGTVEAAETDKTIDYSVEDSKKDLTILYVQTGLKLAKLYAPSVVLGTASITSIIAGHNILRKRNVALAAAYTIVDKSYKEYRGRVIERFGEGVDRELRYNIKAMEIEETEVDEKGKEKTVKKTVNVVDPNDIGDYAKIWHEGNRGWTKDPEMNFFYLKKQQAWCNNVLKTRGHLFLNEVYDLLGFPRTAAGNIVGWYYDEKNPTGDNFVDFGLFDIHDEKKADFINGYERSVIIDPNVDGPIIDYI